MVFKVAQLAESFHVEGCVFNPGPLPGHFFSFFSEYFKANVSQWSLEDN